MPTNEKEINNYLFDQLSIVENIEKSLKRDGIISETAPETFEQLETERQRITRKLYQNPELTGK